MASGTFKWYGKAAEHLADADIDWVADTIKVLLTTSSYTPDQDAHDYANDVVGAAYGTAPEVSGTGYSAGGASLTTKTLNYDTGTNTLRLRADDVSWSSSTITNARTAVLYKYRGGATSADELIGYCTFDQDVSSSSGTFTLDFDPTNGVLQLTAS